MKMRIYQKLKVYNNRTALIQDNGEIYSYKKILNQSNSLSKFFYKRKVIFLLVDNNVESILSLVACDIKNSVAMLLPSKIDIEALNNLIRLYNPKIIFSKISSKIKHKDYKVRNTFLNYEILINKKKTYLINNNDLFLLLSTSGSTGSAKNVKITFDNLIYNTNSISKSLNINKSHRAITTMPPNYVYGLSIINTHLLNGGSLVLTSFSFFQKNFWKLLTKYNVNNFGGVPYNYEILDKIGLSEDKLRTIKYFTQAGGHLDEKIKKKLLDFCNKFKKKYYVMYGSAEATARMSILQWKDLKFKINSIGKPLSDCRFDLIDDQGKKIFKPKINGELVFKGKNVFQGYSKKFSDLNKKKNLSYHKTGDLGYYDEEGFYYISGKKSRYIKLAGNRISLDEVEKLLKIINVKSICIQNIKDKIDIFILKKVAKIHIQDYISKKLGLNKAFFEIILIKNFPRNNNNKINYDSKLLKR